jgi:hypothetical protein
VTWAILKQAGNVDSLRQRLIKVVIGGRRLSRQDLSIRVGMKSSEQVASDEARMASLTSADVAGVKSDNSGGEAGGSTCGEVIAVGSAA